MKELLDLFRARRLAPQLPYALATVLGIEGSGYRRTGARMLINLHGRVAGSVSGGCLEQSVISQGRATLLDGANRLLFFDTTDQDDSTYGSSLGCQGRICIGLEFVPPSRPWALERLVGRVWERRRPAALVTGIRRSSGVLSFVPLTVFSKMEEGYSSLPLLTRDRVDRVFAEKKSCGLSGLPAGSDDLQRADLFSGDSMVEWLTPPVSLLIFGAGPDVLPLVILASTMGHEVTVIDRRPEFAHPENFPGAHSVLCAKPHQIVARLKPDSRTVAVIMNHHYETDRDVLAALLPLDLPYIAILGPKRRTIRIVDELTGTGAEGGFDPSIVHGPAGLDIGAETPEEIALAILAEIQSALTGRSGGKLRNHPGPLHDTTFRSPEPLCVIPA